MKNFLSTEAHKDSVQSLCVKRRTNMKTTLSILTIVLFFLVVFFQTKLFTLPETYYAWLGIIGPAILYPTFYAGFSLIKKKNNIKTDIIFIAVTLFYLICETGGNIVLFGQAIALLTGYVITRIISNNNRKRIQ